VHLMLGTPGDPFHQLAQRDQQRMFAWGAANALACLAAGLTTIFDCGGPGDATIQLRDAFQDGLVSGPRVLAAGARIMTTAGHCHWLGETIEYLDYDDAVARQMGQQGTYVDFNIGGAIGRLRGRDGVPREWPYGETVPETRWEIGRQMQRYGVRVYLTSDAIGRAYDTLPRNVISMPERFGEAPADLISRITSVPAQALGLEEQIGTIRPGLSADLLVVRGDAERDLSGLARPELVFLRGELVAERGRVSLPSRHTGSP
ncbi:MAG TPA: amidohydrolase family protein, partial [Chloroflexota bacterium]|nr:amidohydrolase family protein [Chloroflexota bacterium]